MSMSEDDRDWLGDLLSRIQHYTYRRFMRGAEEHSETPLTQRTCLSEAIQEVNDAQTYLFTFRLRLNTWIRQLSQAANDQNWPLVQRVQEEMYEELRDEPSYHPPDSRVIR